ncbi:MAG: hypothetical protein S4CHLAM37_09720 [Chlamydiia bacterium]|nr:hypothetical protein [Chlamydiia bacterium]
MSRFTSFLKKIRNNPFLLLSCMLLVLTGCEHDSAIVTGVDEREANMIVVFLESKGIHARKVEASSGPEIGGQSTGPKFAIHVDQSQAVDAMSILNRNGLPRKSGTNLLELFAKQGLMTSDKEENIRYQAGLAQQIANTILMIDGVIDTSVQLSFPNDEGGTPEEEAKENITAAVYVKHQGVYDDPNNHLENKIKRIVSGSITGLDINNVTVVSDRSRFTDVSLSEQMDKMTKGSKEYVSIWSIVLNKASAGRFRAIFFILILFTLVFAVVMGWLFWKFYPIIRKKGGFKELLNPTPITNVESETKDPSDESVT